MEDAKTLRLAAPVLDEDALRAFAVYQQAFLGYLQTHPVDRDGWAGRLAFAHGSALRDCGLDAGRLAAVAAVCADFCGRASVIEQLVERQQMAKARVEAARAAGRAPPAQETELVARIGEELVRLQDMTAFTARYGEGSLAVLRRFEATLVALHRRVVAAQGGGHLHLATA